MFEQELRVVLNNPYLKFESPYHTTSAGLGYAGMHIMAGAFYDGTFDKFIKLLKEAGLKEGQEYSIVSESTTRGGFSCVIENKIALDTLKAKVSEKYKLPSLSHTSSTLYNSSSNSPISKSKLCELFELDPNDILAIKPDPLGNGVEIHTTSVSVNSIAEKIREKIDPQREFAASKFRAGGTFGKTPIIEIGSAAFTALKNFMENPTIIKASTKSKTKEESKGITTKENELLKLVGLTFKSPKKKDDLILMSTIEDVAKDLEILSIKHK